MYSLAPHLEMHLVSPVMLFSYDEDESYRETKGTHKTFVFQRQPLILLVKQFLEILAPSYMCFKGYFNDYNSGSSFAAGIHTGCIMST